ncbi:Ribulose-phosphate 3-epimerase [Taphrina deformans PYCC 5710]|uniref:Ribulose-phosphate 3-epimerase n=1 Tax=Taphrina deformans (strain PYCC 5710 / ATCC 11124 / CBS 356.35 / IMI 108563 / JCM 9778 / NBRC 8474) TaxID=1097556 RepID=R4X8U0_TAPDE|nr:Ribulose-phosphate 3-epimerase [Taphrina deformans PYCC 5710]|eukprot:CCG81840.1 Ribulose-phosphate 3-epimerase [Taphrina deformans PYCC 5710]
MALDALIAPSLLACDFGAIRCECGRMMEAGSDWLHVDVMDGHFVPNLSYFDVGMLRDAVPRGSGVLDLHMMVSDPGRWVDRMASAGADSFTFHVEAVTAGGNDPGQLVDAIHGRGMRAACALKPGTPADAVAGFAHKLDMVLVMTVEPGFGGQSFMPDMMPKVRTLRERYPGLDIQVDGGITVDTVGAVADSGANCIVSGTGIFKAKDPAQAIATMRQAVESSGFDVRKGTPENQAARRGSKLA